MKIINIGGDYYEGGSNHQDNRVYNTIHTSNSSVEDFIRAMRNSQAQDVSYESVDNRVRGSKHKKNDGQSVFDASNIVLSQKKYNKLKELLVGKSGRNAAIIIQASLICGAISFPKYEDFEKAFGANILGRTMYYEYIGYNKKKFTQEELDPIIDIFNKIED